MSAFIVSLPSAEMASIMWILFIATGECGGMLITTQRVRKQGGKLVQQCAEVGQ